ncbi:glycosyltransferase family 2 protein [Parasphingorhabdus sp.]|uniref:glycosyltransferase family 2 protein n=1 Tax=Parasphingorhabdus sp. TaxID=2709688 RepID=UPI003A9160C7
MVTNEIQKLIQKSSLIIPVLNAEPHLDNLLPALKETGYPADQIVVIDSASKDRTVERFKEFGAQVYGLGGRPFNHGGTRKYAAELVPESEYLIYLTQDAIPFNKSTFNNILTGIAQAGVGMAYGRQLPRRQAKAIERHARIVNYTDQSAVRVLADRKTMGVKTTFSSDSFSVYSRRALEAVGHFPEDAYFGEDQILAGKMLLRGYKIFYCADAEVTHSHGYSIKEDFRRYFDVGIFHATNRWLLEEFGAAEGEGLKFLKSEISFLLKHEPTSIPSACLRTLAKYAGYRLGRMEEKMSIEWKMRLGMQPFYWRQKQSEAFGKTQ